MFLYVDGPLLSLPVGRQKNFPHSLSLAHLTHHAALFFFLLFLCYQQDRGTMWDAGIDLVSVTPPPGVAPLGWGAARLGRLFLERFTRGMRLTRAGWVSDTSLQGRSAQTAEEKTDFLSLWRHHEKETIHTARLHHRGQNSRGWLPWRRILSSRQFKLNFIKTSLLK